MKSNSNSSVGHSSNTLVKCMFCPCCGSVLLYGTVEHNYDKWRDFKKRKHLTTTLYEYKHITCGKSFEHEYCSAAWFYS